MTHIFLKKIFTALHLNKSESIVLLSLFESGPCRVTELASSTALNRTTLYGILKILAKKGLVSSFTMRGVLEYQSIQPNLLVDYLERQKIILEERKSEVVSILPELIRMRTGPKLFPHVQFFEGVEGIKQAYEDTLKNNEGKVLYDFTGTDAVFQKMGKDWVEYYVKKRTKLGIKCFDITPNSDWSQKSKKRDHELNRMTKFLPAEFTFDTEVALYDNKVAIFSFAKERPIAVIIEDEQITKTLKTLFTYIERTLQ